MKENKPNPLAMFALCAWLIFLALLPVAGVVAVLRWLLG